MKIATNIFNSPPTTGPGNFARRLASKLSASGFDFTDEQYVRKADIYYCSALLNPNLAEVAKQMNIPVILRVDGRGIGNDKIGVAVSHKLADICIYQSDFSRKLLQAELGQPKDWVVIHNGIEVPNVPLPSPTNVKFISICNTWNEIRWANFRDAIANNLTDIIYKFPGFKWVIVGKVESVKKELKHPAVEFIDYPADLDKIRRNAYACIHLVQHDSCPNSLIESMSYGLPSIVWKDSAGPELIDDGKAGVILNDFSAKSIIDALYLVVRNYVEFSTNARLLAEKRWNIDVCAERYIECFQKSCSME